MKRIVIPLITLALFFSATTCFITDAQARRRDKQSAVFQKDEYIGTTSDKICYYRVNTINGYEFSIRKKGSICSYHIYYDMESNTYCDPSVYNNYCNDW